jgi:hypothetical protein
LPCDFPASARERGGKERGGGGKTSGGKAVAGSPEWRRRTLESWDGTLSRVAHGGAKVVVVRPRWFAHATPGQPDVQRVRDLYREWAGRHQNQVNLADIAPVACPTGPPCAVTGGIDFRPDGTHFDDPGGIQAATYLTTHVPALLSLIGHH